LLLALLLSTALPSTGWPQAGARQRWGPEASRLFVRTGPMPATMLLGVDTTSRQIRPTYWKEGGIAGGIVFGLLGAAAGGGLCAYSDQNRDCTGATLLGAVGGGLIGGTIGALIGGQFSKSSPSDTTDAESPGDRDS
jgi:hypothetical protein